LTDELRAVATSRDVSGAIATRARIVLWTAEGRMRKDVGALGGVSLPTVDRWLVRYEKFGLTGLEESKRGAGREQMPAHIPERILALTRTSPPAETGLSHWSSREMAAYIARTEGIPVSWHYVAKLRRDNRLQPHRQGTFKLSRDARLADKVFDAVGLYLHPPAGAVVLSVDVKSQVQALDRTQPLLPVDFGLPRDPPTTTAGMAPRTCSPPWTSRPALSSRTATRSAPEWSCSPSCARRSHLTGARRSTSCWTTCPLTTLPAFRRGRPPTRTSPSTSPRSGRAE
jgi:transposase